MAGTIDRIGAVIDAYTTYVSMESGLDGRNNLANVGDILSTYEMSQWSPA